MSILREMAQRLDDMGRPPSIEDVKKELIVDDDGLCTLNDHNRRVLAGYGAKLMYKPIYTGETSEYLEEDSA